MSPGLKKPYKFSVLASGSKGNCSIHDPTGDGKCFLIDSGISDKKIAAGLAGVNRSMDQVRRVFITHEHGDHLPKNKAGRGCDMPGGELDVIKCRGYIARRVPMFHDVQCDALVITSNDGIKVCHITDTAEVPKDSLEYMDKPHAIVIEANWDGFLLNRNLQEGSVSECVMERSIDTHLSNDGMADVIEQLMWDGLEVIVLIHLSSSNNSPDLARQAAEEVLEKGGFLAGKGDGKCRVIVSGQDKPTELIILRGKGL